MLNPLRTRSDATQTDAAQAEAARAAAVALTPAQQRQLWAIVQQVAQQQGFSACGVSDVNLRHAEAALWQWLAAGMHGSMHYMQRHGTKRTRPAELIPGTVRVLSLAMPYLSELSPSGRAWQRVEWSRLRQPNQGTVSLYARGRDYHKVLRKRLQNVADAMRHWLAQQGMTAGVACRVFTDSAPVMEVAIAEKSGVGWRGKHTLALRRDAGSMFFLGEIYTNIPLPVTPAQTSHCGSCTACLDICPTQAIVAPHVVDARRCISYLTIEHNGNIPLALRPLLGNRIYGCDDCQLTCPWNKYAQPASVPDFAPRAVLYDRTLVEYLLWDEAAFLRTTEGSPIRRIGHHRWQRNVAVAMGNALHGSGLSDAQRTDMRAALQAVLQRETTSEMVAEHVRWALSDTC